MANQVGDLLAAVLWSFEAQQGLGGAVPPLQVAVAVEHDHRIPQRSGGLLNAVDHRLQAAPHTLVPALQVVDAVEHLAPQAIAVGRRLVGLMVAEPVMQQLLEGPSQVQCQANGQAPAIVAADQPADQADADQQQQVANQCRVPVLVQLMGPSDPAASKLQAAR